MSTLKFAALSEDGFSFSASLTPNQNTYLSNFGCLKPSTPKLINKKSIIYDKISFTDTSSSGICSIFDRTRKKVFAKTITRAPPNNKKWCEEHHGAFNPVLKQFQTPTQMKILIINLDSKKCRMAFQEKQMQRLGLKYVRLSAIQPTDIHPLQLASKAIQWERPMLESEVACLYSHRTAWQMVLLGDEPVLVMEDDALLSRNVPEILAKLKTRKELDHVTLEVRGRKKLLGRKLEKLDDKVCLKRLYQDRSGAAAYVLWPNGARALLENSDRSANLADGTIASAYNIASWQIEPAAAMQLDQCNSYGINCPLDTASSIDSYSGHKPPAKNLLWMLNFKYRRIISQLRMGIRRLAKLIAAKRRTVEVAVNDFQTVIPTQYVTNYSRKRTALSAASIPLLFEKYVA